MIVGMAFVVTGLVLLKAAGLVTGGIAGIALLAASIFPLPVGLIFTLVNIPFFIFAYFVMGRALRSNRRSRVAASPLR